MGKGKKIAKGPRYRGKRSNFKSYRDLQHFDDIPIEDFSKPHNDPLHKPPSLDHLDLSDEDPVELTGQYYTAAPPSLLHDSFYYDTTASDITFPSSSTTNDFVPTFDLSTKIKKKRRDKAQKARKIIPGDDLYISSDDSLYLTAESGGDDDGLDETMMEGFSRNNGMTLVYHDEAAIDEDFIENTDPDTWQQLQRWATQRSVDEPIYISSDDEETIPVAKAVETSDYAMFDFGLDDSDDDEYIQDDKRRQEDLQQASLDKADIMRNSLDAVPPSLHAGMLKYIKTIRTKKKKPTVKTYNNPLSIQLARIDRRIQLFLNDHARKSYQLPAMTYPCRNQVRSLAKLYGIDVSFENMGGKMIGPLLTKSASTVCPKRKTIENHIIKAGKRREKIMDMGLAANKKKIRNKQKILNNQPGHPRLTKKQQRSNASSVSRAKMNHRMRNEPPLEHGTTVGSSAAPLTTNNVGHKMLAKMGWKAGDSLGTNNDGILDPIQAVIRARGRGLGA